MNSDYSKRNISEQIKAEALRLGFSACGIAPAAAVEEDTRQYFGEWISGGKHADMRYMENHSDKRTDPRLLVEGTRSIVVVALNYYPAKLLAGHQYQFAWYAYGKDYHDVMRRKLRELFAFVDTRLTPVGGRVFCDTAPVLERYWAWRAGLGWIGKNTQLIIPRAGSCFFLGEVFLDIELEYDTPVKERCGNCTNCIDCCPTQALESPWNLNANKCLSYLTIENKGDIPDEYAEKAGNRIYGCDECQKACPWNKFALPGTTPELQPSEEFLNMTREEWNALTREEYNRLFGGSAVKRARYEGLLRNVTQASRHASQMKPSLRSGETFSEPK